MVRDDNKTVFVRNISFKASESEIVDFFEQAGSVEDVRRQTDDQGPLLFCPAAPHCLLSTSFCETNADHTYRLA